MKKRYYFSLRNRLIIVFIGAMLSGMVFTSLVAFYSMYYSMEENTYKNMETSVTTVADGLDQSFALVENTTLELAASEGIGSWLLDTSYYNEDNETFYVRKDQLSKEFQRTLVYSNTKKLNMISYASIFVNGKILDYTDVRYHSVAKILEDSKQAYQKTLENDGEYIYSIPVLSSTKTIFHVRRMKTDFEKEDEIAILLATDENDIREKYSELVAEDGQIAYLVNSKNQIYSSNNEKEIDAYLEDDLVKQMESNTTKDVIYQGVEYFMTEKNLPESDMKFICLYPKYMLTNQVFTDMKSYLLINAGILIIFLVTGLYLSIRSTKFIHEFVSAMKSVREKNYDIKIQKYKDADLSLMADAFNEMTTEIKELIRNKYESQILLQEMEINFLQQQMNPHFLFNVLLTIQIKAKRNSDESIYQMTSALSSLLRASIYTKDVNKITVKEELKYAEFYLYLQKMRFEDKLTYTIDVEDDSVNQYKIPKFIIEPMVENAVVHGIETMEEAAIIKIYVIRKGNDLVITVQDNGVGFDVGKYLEEKAKTKVIEPDKRESIGIKNVDARIKYIYGEDYGISISSFVNQGTTVTVKVPVVEEKESCTV